VTDLAKCTRAELEAMLLLLILQRAVGGSGPGGWETAPPTPERVRAHALRHPYAPNPEYAPDVEVGETAVGLWMVRDQFGHGLMELGFASDGTPWAWSRHVAAFHSEKSLDDLARHVTAWLPLTASGLPAEAPVATIAAPPAAAEPPAPVEAPTTTEPPLDPAEVCTDHVHTIRAASGIVRLIEAGKLPEQATLADLATVRRSDLLKLKGFGGASLAEVTAMLARAGLAFAPEAHNA
jgi:hypothetical protein